MNARAIQVSPEALAHEAEGQDDLAEAVESWAESPDEAAADAERRYGKFGVAIAAAVADEARLCADEGKEISEAAREAARTLREHAASAYFGTDETSAASFDPGL